MYVLQPDTSNPTPILRIIRHGEDMVPQMFARRQHWNAFDTMTSQSLWDKKFILEYQPKKHIDFKSTNTVELWKQSDIFPFTIYIIALLFFTASKVYSLKLFSAILQSVFSFTRFSFWYRQQPAGFKNLILFLFPSSMLFLSMYLWQYTKYFLQPQYSDYWVFGFILIFTLLFFGIRLVLMKTAAYIYETQEATAMLHRNNIFFISLYSFTGILLIPIMLFYRPMLWVAIPYVIAGIESFRLLRSLQIARAYTHYPLFFFFLYLCTIEIIPVLLNGYVFFLLIK